MSVRYATEHRCGVVVRGPGLSDQISGTDPLKDNLPLQVGCRPPAARSRPASGGPATLRHAAPGCVSGMHRHVAFPATALLLWKALRRVPAGRPPLPSSIYHTFATAAPVPSALA